MLIVISVITWNTSYGQVEPDTLKDWNLYRPQQQQEQDPKKINQDSTEMRMKFVQDSILAREEFIRDSIMRRQKILDSLTSLRDELQPLLEAVYWTTREDIISHADKITFIGDSTLNDYVYHKLPVTLADPYCPWKGRLSLAPKSIRFNIDNRTKKITRLEASPALKCGFSYANRGMLLIIQEDFTIQNNSTGSFYKIPVDSVFYDQNKRIVKIKRYMHFYKLEPNYRKGEYKFTNLTQVRQFQYGPNSELTHYELVRFYDRYNPYDPIRVSGIIKYTVAKQGNNYIITRRNDPENEYTDGTFTLVYDGNENIKSIAFKNLKNSRNWDRFVEVNNDGNVKCYIDKEQGITKSTTCMNYHNEPGAKYPVEIINTTFEKDGISYLQKNLTTNKARTRDRLTMEWGPWR